MLKETSFNPTQTIKKHFPKASLLPELESRIENSISKKALTLRSSVLKRAENAIKAIYEYSRTDEHLKNTLARLTPHDQEILVRRSANDSVLMGYDFHYLPETDQLSLIEINTNASGYLLASLQELDGTKTLRESPTLTKLLKSFEAESLAGNGKKLSQILIIDENISQQKMLAEFYMYQDLFESFGLKCEIREFNQVEDGDSGFPFIYNRYCDFTLSDEKSKKLRELYLNRSCVFSPNPSEYLLLADKSVLIDLYSKKISETILEIKPTSGFDSDELWTSRKEYFFKPARLFGAKAVYKGSSITRSTFEKVLQDDYLAQRLSPPGKINDWKFDLRFYVYRDQVQLSTARVYKGQVTNFGNLGGGFAQVIYQ